MLLKSASVATMLSGILLVSISAGSPALADVSAHCQQDGYCLFSATEFAGEKVSVPTGSGCRSVAYLGITTARSAARGYGDSKVLELFSDNQCSNYVGTVVGEVANTSAAAYRIMSIPS
ncbi:hypothetical protein [Amycolatopsis sp. cg13]|uniref:hypothetical protein n=1 Tax=Amycolatopsis sp. cg13 TaxID=3238807 RepID=UPI003525CAA3